MIGFIAIAVIGHHVVKPGLAVSADCPSGYTEIHFGPGAYACQRPSSNLN
jgi:hypothetical protein